MSSPRHHELEANDNLFVLYEEKNKLENPLDAIGVLSNGCLRKKGINC